jgi:hypothetical protein
MARKHNQTGRTRHASRFAMLPHYLLGSAAWRFLSLAARAAFVEILVLYVPGRNGKLGMSARMLADRLPISRATATRALNELRTKGFVEAVKPGGFNVKAATARATEWRLTLFKCDVTGAAASNDFMRWKTAETHSTASPQCHSGLTAEPVNTEKGEHS